MSHDPAPLDLDEVLDPAWLSFALSTPTAPVRVDEVDVVETIVTMATKVRVVVRYASAPTDLPDTLCIKGYFGGHHPPGRTRNSIAEVNFYSQVAPLQDLRLPQVLYCGIDEQTHHGVLVMADLTTRGATFLDALDPFTPDQTADALQQLAIVHADTWNGKGLGQLPWLTHRMAQMVEAPSVPAARIDELFDDRRGDRLPSTIKQGQRIERAVQRLAGFLGDRAGQCLVHGDAHAGNTYTLDGRQGLVDWQVVQRNHWAVDVAYHIASTLTVEQREAHEEALLRSYLEQLSARGVTAPGWNDAHETYRASMAYGYYLWCITQRVAPPITNELVHRLGSAVVALGTFDLLETT